MQAPRLAQPKKWRLHTGTGLFGPMDVRRPSGNSCCIIIPPEVLRDSKMRRASITHGVDIAIQSGGVLAGSHDRIILSDAHVSHGTVGGRE